ncbi:MAG TPA: ATP-binding protein [Bryobacteraceae bacterium]|nr:ATP-binding protein [Bryobacteraceae bacterium]
MQPPDLTTRNPAPDLALPWVVRLRYGIALGGAVVLALASVRFGLSAALACSFVPLAAVLVSNLLLARLRAQVERAPESAVAAVFAMDTLCLTVMLGLTGGSANPFSLLYLVQITLSAVVLEKTWTWALGALSMVCFGALFFWRVPFTPFEGHHIDSASPHLVGMWVAFVIAAALIAFFTGKISEALRRREREVLSLQDRIAKNERLASLATLAAGAAHELGTPLGTIAVVARELELYAARMGNGQAVEEDARLIRSEIERSRLILQQMSADGGEPMGEAVRRIAARDLALQAVAQLAEVQRSNVDVVVAVGDAVVTVPALAVARSIGALLRNGLDASAPGDRVTLQVRTSGSATEFAVIDRGHGMASDVLQRVSEPFFTTKEPGKGMGLGAFLVRTMAERLGGELVYESAPGTGTTAKLTLPLTPVAVEEHATR